MDEKYGETETLLGEVEEEEGQKEKDKIKKEKEENIAKVIRTRALENCTPKKIFILFIVIVNIISNKKDTLKHV